MKPFDVKQPKALFQPRSKEFHSAFHFKHFFRLLVSQGMSHTDTPVTVLLLFNTIKLQLDLKRC